MRIDIGDTETESHMRAKVSTAKLLARLKAVHSRPCDIGIEREIIPRMLPPIPNGAIKAAADIAMFSPSALNQVEAIQRAVLFFYPGVTLNDLKSGRRDHKVIKPRQIAMYMAKVLTTRSLPEIGRRFGGKDHTTVLHAVRKYERLIETDAVIASEVAAIRASLEAA